MDEQNKINAAVSAFFDVISKRHFQCKLCIQPHPGIKGNVFNLKEHLIATHIETAKAIGVSEITARKRKSSGKDVSKKKITIEIDLNDLRRGLVMFVMAKCLSFRAFDDAGFRLAFGSFFGALDMTINRQEIRRLILYAAKQIRLLLTQKLRNRMICLMYDGAKRQNRSVFGVKAQVIDGKEMKVVGLGALTITDRHTSEYFAEELELLLSSFEIPVDNLYAVTSDTAATMLKTSRLLKEAQSHFFTFELFLDDVSDNDKNEETLINDPMLNTHPEDDFEGCSSLATPDEVEVHPTHGVYVAKDESSIVSIVHCCAHVCQLCANDVSKTLEKELNSIRAFVKECKKAVYHDLFKQTNVKIPVLDTDPRWDTKYLMCNSIWSQKEVLQTFTNKKLQLAPSTWEFLGSYVDTFNPIFLAMKEF